MRVAFVGLGNIGAPMAHRLVAAHKGAMVYDVLPAAAAAFAGEAHIAKSIAEIGQQAEMVALCVRDDADVEAVVAGAGGLLSGMQGGMIAVHSTIRPSTVVKLAQKAGQQGVKVVDAAVTGGAAGAAKGALTAMVGADADTFAVLQPVLGAYCSDILHAGGVGAGMALKLCNNLVTYAELGAALEAYRLAEALGLDEEQLTTVMHNNGNLTPSMQQFIAFRKSGAQTLGRPAFRKTQEALAFLGEKDLKLALEAAGEAGMPAPLTGQVQALFRETVMKGLES